MLFRTNSYATKILKHALTTIGEVYLHSLTERTITAVTINADSLEVIVSFIIVTGRPMIHLQIDPAKLKEGQVLETNVEILARIVGDLVQTIATSVNACPV